MAARASESPDRMYLGIRQLTTDNRQRCAPSGAQLMKTPQHLRHAPRLRCAAARLVGRLGIEDFADRSDAGFSEMRFEAVQESQCAGGVGRMYFEPGVDERSDQPGPDSSLMVCGVARAKIAVVRWFVIRA